MLHRSRLGVGLATLAALPLWPMSAQDAPLVGVRVDADRNRLLLEVPQARLGQDLLHQVVLATGGGQGALGLDRGQTGNEAVVRLERRGKRLVLLRDNWTVRALGASEASRRAAAEGFPTSVVAQFPIERDSAGLITADATGLFLSDAYGIRSGLGREDGAAYRLVDSGGTFSAGGASLVPGVAE
ncbi:MAG: hypothetical protein ACK53W_12025, partial [Gemmatimonadota bacterium]